jgi:hypothetical protein
VLQEVLLKFNWYILLVKIFINEILLDDHWNPDTTVPFGNIWMFCMPDVEDEASLLRLQNPLLYLIMSHMNPVHIFITYLFTIPCNHLIHLLCWKILISHLKFEILWSPVLTVTCLSALKINVSSGEFLISNKAITC